MKKIVWTLGATLIAATNAYAQPGAFEISAGGIVFDDTNYAGILGRVGYTQPVFDNTFALGVEAEAGIGLTTFDFSDELVLTDGNNNFTDVLVEQSFEISDSIGGYFIARTPITSKFGVIGRAGYRSTSYSARRDIELLDPNVDPNIFPDSSLDQFRQNISGTFEGISGGVGIEYAFNRKSAIRFDLTFVDKKGVEITEGNSWASIVYARRF